ncbi:ABC transporter substrate-binding protein [Nocardia alni]|uniref:ABC transporter substrate-binding protein n=1 Tax=Nocardia alni TaxID=2815723 RepID=UPI001C24588A|nr:ABC transporter substrate-binding protein [Nocardia alni]
MFRSTRRLFGVSAAASAALLALTACGGSADHTPNPPPTDHVLRLSFLQDPGQPPDPDIFYAAQGLLLTTNTYEGLLQFAPGTDKVQLQPLLATSWTASPDNRVFTFQLRQGVTFHDGTPFTSAAIKASFDRRTAVDQGPAYMVSDVDSVTTQGDYAVTITLKAPNAVFLDYLASPYGPRMMSPTGLAAHAGTDHDQAYLTTHDLGTGPYTLTDARVGSHYAMASYAGYWGAKPYFTSVDIPVITDTSAEQLQFNNGQLAAIMHDLPSSAVSSYIGNSKFANYSLPTMMSNYLYVNPHKGMFTDQATRMALLKTIDVKQIVQQTYFGRGGVATQVYPPNMIAASYAKQNVSHDISAFAKVVSSLPAGQKTITVGYDSGSVDNQLVSNLIQTQLAALGLTVKVQPYPTSQIYGWVGTTAADAPEILVNVGWPDAPSPYTWAHISFDPDGGLNYLNCSSPDVTASLAVARGTGADDEFSTAGEHASATGCWLNMADLNDFMVAQPWLKGVAQSHVVSNPNTLRIAGLSVG